MFKPLVLKTSTFPKWSCWVKGGFLLILVAFVACSLDSPLHGQPTSGSISGHRPAAFAVPSFSYGNAPRNFLRSPHDSDADLSLFKSFHFGESAILSFRAEAFNVLNIQNYGTPDSGVGDPNEGKITGNVLSPRQLQLGLHLQY